MFKDLIDKIKKYAASKDYSEGFFSKKMKVRIAVMVLAIIFLIVAKNYEDRKQEKALSLEQAAAKVAERGRDTAGVDNGPAPDFALKTADGADDRLSAHFGRPIVLSFWATWSDESQQTLPTLDDAFDKYGEDVDFMLVNLTDGKSDTTDSVTTFLKNAGYGFPVYYDSEHYGEVEYNVLTIPLTVFIDKSGNVTACVLDRLTDEQLDSRIAEIAK